MSIRTRILKVAAGVTAAAAMVLGSSIAAQATTVTPKYFVTNQILKVHSTGLRWDVEMGASDRSMGTYKFEGHSYRNYNHWVIELHRVGSSSQWVKVTGDAYLMNYVSYNLENHNTNAWLTTYSSATNLKNLILKGKSMSESQLISYAKTHMA